MASLNCSNKNSNSNSDEERVRKLFQACDTNGDGFIDSQDMSAICQQLCLENSVDELMEQLGADSQGRISYENFFQRRVALKPEIEALHSGSKNEDNASEDSQAKLDSWEWDSGARDMSPVPKLCANKTTGTLESNEEQRFCQQLEEQSQRYEEQITELHSVIAELTKKLDQQSVLAIAEEDEVSEVETSIQEGSTSCSLEVSEFDPQYSERALSDTETKAKQNSKIVNSKCKSIECDFPSSEVVESLQQEIIDLKAQLLEAQLQLTQNSHIIEEKSVDFYSKFLKEAECEAKTCEEKKLDIKCSNIVSIQKTNVANCVGVNCAPITKIAERIKLKRATDSKPEVSSSELVATNLPTSIAEHIVGDILRQCDSQSEKKWIDFELRRLSAKVDHSKAQNSVLTLTLTETKAHCDRLALLCGKYESNALALRLALGIMDRTIEAYDVLLALLETELALDESNRESIENRIAAESVAQQLLTHLDSYQSTDVLLSPWQNHRFTNLSDDPWSPEKELKLREHVSRLKAERSNIQGTYVTLESPQIQFPPNKPLTVEEANKFDLEMAVIIQELMSLREDKAELISQLFALEKEKGAIKLKLTYIEGQQKAQGTVLKNLQEHLKETENLLSIANQKDGQYNEDDHLNNVEIELVQTLAREGRLKVRLQELISTLQQVTESAEKRLLENREVMQDLNLTNSVLTDTLDRNHKKYQSSLKKMEQRMQEIIEQHNTQVETLQQRIAVLETPLKC